MKLLTLLGLVIAALFIVSCAPPQKLIVIEDTQGCSLIYEYESIVAPVIEQECTTKCSPDASYTGWQCSDEDLIECICE